MPLTHAQALRRVTERLDAPRPDGEKWSTDFFRHDRDALPNYLARQGRSDDFGRDYEDLADPYAVHVPGCAERSVAALLDALADTGLMVAAETKPGKPPRFGLDQHWGAGRHPGLRFLAQLDAALSAHERTTDAGDTDPLAAMRAAARAAVDESRRA